MISDELGFQKYKQQHFSNNNRQWQVAYNLEFKLIKQLSFSKKLFGKIICVLFMFAGQLKFHITNLNNLFWTRRHNLQMKALHQVEQTKKLCLQPQNSTPPAVPILKQLMRYKNIWKCYFERQLILHKSIVNILFYEPGFKNVRKHHFIRDFRPQWFAYKPDFQQLQ